MGLTNADLRFTRNQIIARLMGIIMNPKIALRMTTSLSALGLLPKAGGKFFAMRSLSRAEEEEPVIRETNDVNSHNSMKL